MFYYLTSALKERILTELRFFWSRHPRYVSDDQRLNLVSYIQGKYPFDERPQRSITVKNASSTHVSLSADNFVGNLSTHAFLARMPGMPSTSIEWVKENERLVSRYGGFPSEPGIYFVEITKSDDVGGTGGEFIVDPVVDREAESVLMSSDTVGQLQGSPVPGTLRLYEEPGDFPLNEGQHFTVSATGEITLTYALTGGRSLSADYRVALPRRGPFPFRANHSDVQAIPGVVLVFGRRFSVGDVQPVIVNERRCISAKVYGGRWDITLDFEVMARDVHDQEEIIDASVMYLQGVARSRLSSDGIEVGTINMGGETEELYNDAEDTYYYGASFSCTFQTDWEIHEPMGLTLRRVIDTDLTTANSVIGLSPEEVAQITSNLKILERNSLIAVQDPYYTKKGNSFEKLS